MDHGKSTNNGIFSMNFTNFITLNCLGYHNSAATLQIFFVCPGGHGVFVAGNFLPQMHNPNKPGHKDSLRNELGLTIGRTKDSCFRRNDTQEAA
jgi:hypothetical protein